MLTEAYKARDIVSVSVASGGEFAGESTLGKIGNVLESFPLDENSHMTLPTLMGGNYCFFIHSSLHVLVLTYT